MGTPTTIVVEPSAGAGWIIGQYSGIAANVGDTLVFKYTTSHNVYRLYPGQTGCPTDFMASGAVATLVRSSSAVRDRCCCRRGFVCRRVPSVRWQDARGRSGGIKCVLVANTCENTVYVPSRKKK